MAAHLKQVSVHPHQFELHIVDKDEPTLVSWSPATMQRRRDIIEPPARASETLRPMRVKDRARILHAITERSVRMTLSLAQLAPRIVQALVDGRLSRGIGIRDLADLPASWTEQERALGIV